MIDGSILVGAHDRRSSETFRAIAAESGEAIGPEVSEATPQDIVDACTKAADAFSVFGSLEPDRRAVFLEAVGAEIVGTGALLIETAMAETGLPQARLEGERGRTVNQLAMFAQEVRKGRWLDVVIDPALPDREPPRPDLRRMNVPVGPVAVFGASNFPLAFSVAGGDTASAFAAGCPVVVKGHPAHPGTGEIVARAIRRAAAATGMPEGVFSFLPGRSNALGSALVADPRIKAVGFTGSRSGGLALVDFAQRRPEPIPVYAEMSSINPVVLLPHALAQRSSELGRQFAASLTLGAGQFCTNPGIVIATAGPDLDDFVAAASHALAGAPFATMLTGGIRTSFETGVASIALQPSVHRVGGNSIDGRNNAALFLTDCQNFLDRPGLREEVFGASAVIIACASPSEMAQVLSTLDGQLTITLHCDSADTEFAATVLPVAAERAGRIIANGWPTGVEVTPAMVHGGPFPATSDARTSSVGTLAMQRFLRPVCWQDIPLRLLPLPLQDENPWLVPQLRNA